jgi:hypothetical protein
MREGAKLGAEDGSVRHRLEDGGATHRENRILPLCRAVVAVLAVLQDARTASGVGRENGKKTTT